MSKTKAIFLYMLVSLFLIFEMAVQVSPSIMTNSLMQDLNIGTFGLGIMSGFYFYTYTIFQAPSGMLLDRCAPRKIITLAILTCAIGSALFGVATNIYIGSIARLLLGAGSAFAFVSVLITAADLFENKHFAFFAGLTQALAALGAMSGQVPLSHLVDSLGWRHTLFLLAIIGFMLALLVWIFLDYERHNLMHKDTSPHNAWKSLQDILSNKQTWVIAIYACLSWAPLSGFASLWAVPYFINVYQLTPPTAATLVAFMWLGVVAGSPLLGWWSTYLGQRRLPLWVSECIGFFAFFIILFYIHTPIWITGVLIFVAGGATAGQVLTFSVVRELNHPKQRATALAVNNMAVVISGAIFQPLIGKLLQIHHAYFGGSTLSAYKYSLMVILASYFIATLVAFFLFERREVRKRSPCYAALSCSNRDTA